MEVPAEPAPPPPDDSPLEAPVETAPPSPDDSFMEEPAAAAPPTPDDSFMEAPTVESAPPARKASRKEKTGGSDLTSMEEKVKWHNSIQVRFSAVLFLLTTVILAGFAVYSYITTKNQMESDLNLLAKITASRLSIHLSQPLWDLEDEKVGDSIHSEMLDKQIYAIIVRDSDGKSIFSGRQRNKKWESVQTKKNIRGKYIKNSKKIIYKRKNEKIGVVEVYLTSRYIKEALNQSIIKIVITAAILVVAIFITIFLSMRKMIIQPIMKLTAVSEKMSMGNLDVEIDTRSNNEIGVHARSIERMQASLNMALKRMRQRRSR
ncbi:MAG: HAMP domain-containing protein [Desulfobacterales bacterium]|nr:HAMP domain-containing protein [Desulfobacterales bacterium]